MDIGHYTPFMHQTTIFLLITACALASWANNPWQWVDEAGRTTYSDQPPSPSGPPVQVLRRPGEAAPPPTLGAEPVRAPPHRQLPLLHPRAPKKIACAPFKRATRACARHAARRCVRPGLHWNPARGSRAPRPLANARCSMTQRAPQSAYVCREFWPVNVPAPECCGGSRVPWFFFGEQPGAARALPSEALAPGHFGIDRERAQHLDAVALTHSL